MTYQSGTNQPLPLSIAKGTLPVGSGTNNQIAGLPLGATGQVLTADSSQSVGVKWATATGSGSSAVLPGYHSVGTPKFQNSRQATVSNYYVADSTGSVYLSNSTPTTLDISTNNVNGGIFTSNALPGTITYNRTQISGTGTSFTTQFVVGDTIYLPSYKQSRKIVQINNDTEMFTDPGDNLSFADWVSQSGASQSSTQSKFGTSSLSLSGTSYAEMNFYTPLNAIHQYEFTIEGFFYFNALATGTASFGLFNGLTAGRYALYLPASGKLQLYAGSTINGNDIANSVYGTTTVSTGQWNHIAFTYYLGVYTIWLNGKAEIVITNNNPIYSDFLNSLRLGSQDGTAGNYVNGFVDEFRISSCCRYMAAFTPTTTEFVPDSYTLLLNHFNGPSGSIDLNTTEVMRPSPVRWDNYYYGTPTISNAQSKFGGYSMFNSASGVCINTGISAKVDPTTHCFEFWMYPTSVTTATTILDSFNAGFTYNINLTSGSVLAFSIGNNGTSANVATATGTTKLVNNTWYHVALAFDGTAYRLFLNGALYTSVTSSTQPGSGWARALVFGCALGKSGSTGGYFDEVRFSNTARYTAAFTPATVPFTVDANTISLNHMDAPSTGAIFIQDGEQIGGTTFARGGLARNTHYYPYAISNGSTTQIMLSHRCASFGDVVDFPTGYTIYRQLQFSLMVNARGNMPKFVISGKYVQYPFVDDSVFTSAIGLGGDYSVLASGAATSFSAVSCINLIPKISQTGYLGCSLYASNPAQMQIKVRATGDTQLQNGISICQLGVSYSTSNYQVSMAQQNDTFVSLNSLQQFDYKLTAAPNQTNVSFYVRGYQITEV